MVYTTIYYQTTGNCHDHVLYLTFYSVIMIVFLVVCWREVVCLSCQSANSLASFPTPFYPRLHPFCSTLDQVTVMWRITSDKLLAARLFMWLKLQWSCKECYERRDLGMVPHDYSDNIRKWHFYVHDKFMRIRQNRPLDKFMHSSILCIVMYGTRKIIILVISPIEGKWSSWT